MKKLMSLLLIVVMFLSMAPMSISFANAATDEFAGGSGTPSDPYLISTKYHLDNVRNHLDAHFKMIADIEFTDADFVESGDFYNNGDGWKPIMDKDYSYLYSFTGAFDGDNHYIEGLHIFGDSAKFEHVGLFGSVSGE